MFPDILYQLTIDIVDVFLSFFQFAMKLIPAEMMEYVLTPTSHQTTYASVQKCQMDKILRTQQVQ